MKIYLGLTLMILVFTTSCSSKKSKEAEWDSIANKTSQALTNMLATNEIIRNFLTTNGVSLQTNGKAAEMVGVFSEAIKSDVVKQLTLKTVEASDFLIWLHKNDSLPGISKDEHGQLDSDVVPYMISNELVAVSYPMERTFHLVKTGQTSTNNYVLVQPTKDSGWKLQKAWLTDSNGQVIQEWPVQ